MSLHHLDPRQAGTGAAPDVDVFHTNNIWSKHQPSFAWHWLRFYRDSRETMAFSQTTRPCGYDTESAALAAARAAAGFGHVAERACDTYRPLLNAGYYGLANADDCTTCAWPRDAHKEGSK